MRDFFVAPTRWERCPNVLQKAFRSSKRRFLETDSSRLFLIHTEIADFISITSVGGGNLRKI